MPRSGLALSALLFAAAAALAASEGQQAAVIDPAKAEFKEVVPGVSKAVLWGDPDKGPYGAFTRFKPGQHNALHTHSSDLRLLVVKGAYLYKPENGAEQRIGAGQYLFLPGGDRHVSGGDAKEGAVFYEQSQGGFDLKMIE